MTTTTSWPGPSTRRRRRRRTTGPATIRGGSSTQPSTPRARASRAGCSSTWCRTASSPRRTGACASTTTRAACAGTASSSTTTTAASRRRRRAAAARRAGACLGGRQHRKTAHPSIQFSPPQDSNMTTNETRTTTNGIQRATSDSIFTYCIYCIAWTEQSKRHSESDERTTHECVAYIITLAAISFLTFFFDLFAFSAWT